MAEVDPRPGGHRRRRAAPGRRAVPVEARRDRQPEPARGPPAAAGLPRAACGSPRRPCTSRRRRSSSPAQARRVPRDGPPRGQGVRPRLPQRAHGRRLERARARRRDAAHAHAAGDAADAVRARAGSPTCAATTTSAGRSRRRTPAASGSTGTRTAASWPTSTPATAPAASRAACASSPTRDSGEARTSGTAASLAGLDWALEHDDPWAAELAIRRVLLLHAIAFAHGGLPLIWMGDELGLRNDPAWVEEPGHAGDNRWLHRPRMDWEAAGRRARSGVRRGPPVGRAAAADRGPPRHAGGPRPGHAATRSGPATRTCSGCGAARRRAPAVARQRHGGRAAGRRGRPRARARSLRVRLAFRLIARGTCACRLRALGSAHHQGHGGGESVHVPRSCSARRPSRRARVGARPVGGARVATGRP